MKLHAKIKSKYLDAILSGEKGHEYRQFESLTLTDENGRSEEFQVGGIKTLDKDNEVWIKNNYPDIEWDEELKIRKIGIWKEGD